MLETLDDDDDDPFGPAVSEINPLEQPIGHCQWDRGCEQPAAHNVRQYDSSTGETLVNGVGANYCEPHAHAMATRLSEWE